MMKYGTNKNDEASNPLDDSAKCYDVAIVGGGIAGVVQAIVSADSGLSVILFEALNELMLGTTRAAADRMSPGMHYPDIPTAIKRLKETIIFIRFMLDKGILKQEDLIQEPSHRTKYYIMSQKACDVVGVQGERFSANKFQFELVKAIQSEYIKLCAEDLRNKVFGKVEDFVSSVPKTEWLVEDHEDVEAVFQTCELHLEWQVVNERLCQYLAAPGSNIVVKKNARVTMPDTPNHSLKDDFIVTAVIDGTKKVYTAQNVVYCTSYESMELAKVYGYTMPDYTFRLKALLVIDIKNHLELQEKLHSIFAFCGPFFSVSRLGKTKIKVTYEPYTNVAVFSGPKPPSLFGQFCEDRFSQSDFQKLIAENATDFTKKHVQKKGDIKKGILIELQKRVPLMRCLTTKDIESVNYGVVTTNGSNFNLFDMHSSHHKRVENGVLVLSPGIGLNSLYKMMDAVINADICMGFIRRNVTTRYIYKNVGNANSKFLDTFLDLLYAAKISPDKQSLHGQPSLMDTLKIFFSFILLNVENQQEMEFIKIFAFSLRDLMAGPVDLSLSASVSKTEHDHATQALMATLDKRFNSTLFSVKGSLSEDNVVSIISRSPSLPNILEKH